MNRNVNTKFPTSYANDPTRARYETLKVRLKIHKMLSDTNNLLHRVEEDLLSETAEKCSISASSVACKIYSLLVFPTEQEPGCYKNLRRKKNKNLFAPIANELL